MHPRDLVEEEEGDATAKDVDMEVELGFRVEGEVLGDGTPNLPDVERVATAADQAPPTRCAVAQPSTPSSAAVQFEDGPEWFPSPDYALGK